VAERLPDKRKALSSNPVWFKRRRKRMDLDFLFEWGRLKKWGRAGRKARRQKEPKKTTLDKFNMRHLPGRGVWGFLSAETKLA
jgi:hypothetical protein